MYFSKHNMLFAALFFSLLAGMMFLPGKADAQILREIQITGGYSQDMGMEADKLLKRIKGPAAGAVIHLNLTDYLSVSLEGSYADLTIDQDDPVEQWNWPFWQRFYRNYVRNLVNSDPNYSVVLTPMQNMYMIPVVVAVNGFLPVNDWISPFISLGGGMVFYERNLRLNEAWTKYFPEIDNYFNYEYDNHAGSKKGQAWLARIAVGAEFHIWESFGLSTDLAYTHYFLQQHDTFFPLRSDLSVRAGIVFYY